MAAPEKVVEFAKPAGRIQVVSATLQLQLSAEVRSSNPFASSFACNSHPWAGDANRSHQIGTLITRSPDIRGGRPRVAGTGVTVMRIAGWYKLGHTPEEIARKTGLSLAQIHAALAYYHANREAIDADLEAEATDYDRLMHEHYQNLRQP